MMQTYVKPHRMIARAARIDLRLHLARREYRVVGALENAHDLIAHRLHDAPAVLGGDAAQQGKARVDDRACSDVPKRVVKLGAFADVGEQYGEVLSHAYLRRTVLSHTQKEFLSFVFG